MILFFWCSLKLGTVSLGSTNAATCVVETRPLVLLHKTVFVRKAFHGCDLLISTGYKALALPLQWLTWARCWLHPIDEHQRDVLALGLAEFPGTNSLEFRRTHVWEGNLSIPQIGAFAGGTTCIISTDGWQTAGMCFPDIPRKAAGAKYLGEGNL